MLSFNQAGAFGNGRDRPGSLDVDNLFQIDKRRSMLLVGKQLQGFSDFPSDEEIATLGSNRLNQGKIQLLIYCISSIYYIARVSSQRCTTAYPCPVADLPGAFRDLLLHFSGWLFFPDAFCWYWDALTLH